MYTCGKIWEHLENEGVEMVAEEEELLHSE